MPQFLATSTAVLLALTSCSVARSERVSVSEPATNDADATLPNPANGLAPFDNGVPLIDYILPSGLHETLEGADAVAIVRVIEVLDTYVAAYPTEPRLELFAPGEVDPGPTPPEPVSEWNFTDYDVEVVDALAANADVYDDAHIRMRVMGWAPSAWIPGQKFLVVLVKELPEPVGVRDAYAVNGGPFGAFPMSDTEQITYLGGEPVGYAVGISPDEFVATIRDVVEE